MTTTSEPDLSGLTGRSIRDIDPTYPGLVFETSTLYICSIWRLRLEETILLGSFDYDQAAEPAEREKQTELLRRYVVGRTVLAIMPDDRSTDLHIRLDMGLELDIVADSNSYPPCMLMSNDRMAA